MCKVQIVFVAVFAILAVSICRPSLGEEITISIRNSKSTIGDFGFSSAKYGSSSMLNLSSLSSTADRKHSQCEVKAGDLWKYFKSQGIDSMSSLVLFLDVGDMDRSSTMALESLEISILGGQNVAGVVEGQVISFLSMDSNEDNRLVIPGYESNRSRPEARLELPLGFDFMERFSESSTETLLVNVSYDGDLSLSPVLSIEGKRQLFSMPNIVILGSFIVFWASVFWILKRMTLPQKPGMDSELNDDLSARPISEPKKAAPAA